MDQQEILTQAQQGDPKAIAFLVNQALSSIRVKSRANIQKNCLHLLLESSQLPEREACVRVIQNGMQRLNPLFIDFVNIYGRRLGHRTPDWTEVIELQKPTIFNSRGVGLISWPAEQSNSELSASPTLPSLPPKIDFSQTSVNHVSDKYWDSQALLNQSIRVEETLETAPKYSASQEIYLARKSLQKEPNLYNQNNQTPWLIFGLLGTVLIPISSLFISSQPYRLPAIVSTISPPSKTSQTYSSVVEVTDSVESPIPTPEVTQTQNQVDLSEVSEFLLSSIQSPINPDTRITIKAVGDIIPGTNYPRNKLHPNKEQLFASVKPLLEDADIVFGNFESTLTSYPRSGKKMGSGRVFAFRTPPSYKHLLKDAGFNVLSVANNHSFDFLSQGFEDTINNIQSVGMQAVGKKGEIIYRKVKGVQIAFIAFSNYSYHNSMLDLESAKALVQEADENADIIVISVHGGAEGTRALRIKNKTEYFYGENRGNKILFARTLIDEGADLILGHGPHVPRAMEIYEGKLIAYSLGNFMGYRTLSSKGKLGYSLVLEADVNPRGDFISGKILPVHLNSKGIPYPDKSGRSIKLIKMLTKSDFPNSILAID
nr:CapA family protein [Microcoleaceae cyanobacterium MO_207.B10]